MIEGLIVPSKIFFSYLSPNEKMVCSIIYNTDTGNGSKISNQMIAILIGVEPSSINNIITKLRKENIVKGKDTLMIKLSSIESNAMSEILSLNRFVSYSDSLNNENGKKLTQKTNEQRTEEKEKKEEKKSNIKEKKKEEEKEGKKKENKKSVKPLVKNTDFEQNLFGSPTVKTYEQAIEESKVPAKYVLDGIESNLVSWRRDLKLSKKGKFEDYLKVLHWWLQNVPDDVIKELKKDYPLADFKTVANDFYLWAKYKEKRREKLFQVLGVFLKKTNQSKGLTEKLYNKNNNVKNMIDVKIDTSELDKRRKASKKK